MCYACHNISREALFGTYMAGNSCDGRLSLIIRVYVKAWRPTSPVRWGVARRATGYVADVLVPATGYVANFVVPATGSSLGKEGRSEKAWHDGQDRKEKPHNARCSSMGRKGLNVEAKSVYDGPEDKYARDKDDKRVQKANRADLDGPRRIFGRKFGDQARSR